MPSLAQTPPEGPKPRVQVIPRVERTWDPATNFEVFVGHEGHFAGFAGQQGPVTPDVIVGPGGNFNTIAFAASEMSFDFKVVKAAPYSADAITESTQTLSDGNRIVRKSTSNIYRDSEGRTRREQSIGTIGPWTTSDQSTQRVFISDPVQKLGWVLDPRAQTAQKAPPPPPPPPPSFQRVAQMEADNAAKIAVSEEVAAKLKKTKPLGGVLQGNAIKRVQPEYPSVAKAAGVQGAVQVTITVDETGNVINSQVISGHPLLRDAAIKAAHEWKFKPTEVAGEPVKVEGTVTFNFTLAKPVPPGAASLTEPFNIPLPKTEFKKEGS